MDSRQKITLVLVACMIGIPACLVAGSSGRVRPAPAPQPKSQQLPAPNPGVQLAIGTIRSIIGRTVTLASDNGLNVTVLVPDTARIVRDEPFQAGRAEPGKTDSKVLAQATLADLRVEDRVIVRGVLSDDGTAVVASDILVTKRAEVKADPKAAPKAEAQPDLQLLVDWQKRGVRGEVSVVDAARGIVRISAVGPSGAQGVAIHVTKDTIMRRYAPGSQKIEDAKPGTFSQIMPGDKFQARGARSIDGRDITADEIISGPGFP